VWAVAFYVLIKSAFVGKQLWTYKRLFTKPQAGSKIKYETRWAYFLEVRKSTKRCEMFPTIIVVVTFIMFFKVSGKHQTGVKCSLLSFLLTNVYVLRKPYIGSLNLLHIGSIWTAMVCVNIQENYLIIF
jgi:hypothetical protein